MEALNFLLGRGGVEERAVIQLCCARVDIRTILLFGVTRRLFRSEWGRLIMVMSDSDVASYVHALLRADGLREIPVGVDVEEVD
eukprot:1598523-Pyramimonas_sp.AAC.1